MSTPICITCGSTGKLVAMDKPNQIAFICSNGHSEIWQVEPHYITEAGLRHSRFRFSVKAPVTSLSYQFILNPIKE